jgi:predicted metallopeptidase
MYPLTLELLALEPLALEPIYFIELVKERVFFK